MAEIEASLQQAAARHAFGVLAVHDLQAAMRNKGVEFGSEVRVYEVCNPHQAKKVLDANAALSTALPCRISVYGTPGAYTIATILPSALLAMFGSHDMAPVAAEVEASIKAIMEEAA